MQAQWRCICVLFDSSKPIRTYIYACVCVHVCMCVCMCVCVCVRGCKEWPSTNQTPPPAPKQSSNSTHTHTHAHTPHCTNNNDNITITITQITANICTQPTQGTQHKPHTNILHITCTCMYERDAEKTHIKQYTHTNTLSHLWVTCAQLTINFPSCEALASRRFLFGFLNQCIAYTLPKCPTSSRRCLILCAFNSGASLAGAQFCTGKQI